MIDFQDYFVLVRQQKLVKGSKPVYLEIVKGNHPYKGYYMLTIDEDIIHFYELKSNFKLNPNAKYNFYIRLDSLANYHYAYYKPHKKKIYLYFKDGLVLETIFMFAYQEMYGNDKNAEYFMDYLKKNNILQINEIRSDQNGPKEIKKEDIFFTEAIRKTYKKKRGFFGK